MRIGVIGGGTVGHATARCYMEMAEVRVFDTDDRKCTHPLHNVLESDIIFVCLPTPQKQNSLECDISIIEEFFRHMLAGYGAPDLSTYNFVLRSTVPIGTTRKLRERYRVKNLVHSPEFLTARCAVTDAQIPARNIIGAPPGTGVLESKLIKLYEDRFPGVQVLTMTSDESEAVKLFQNSFFAVKIAMFNELHQLAEKLGLDWETVRQGMLSDGRIAHSHTNIPGPDGQYGYGGMCLPKDLGNLICHYNSEDIKGAAYVMSAAHTRNELIDRRRKA